MNPATYDETTTLKNGQEVRIRAMRSSDKDLVMVMFRNLEPESIYTRFFHAKKVLTDDDLLDRFGVEVFTDMDEEIGRASCRERV